LSASVDTLSTAETPEGIAIALHPAGFAVRCTAFIVDGLIRIGLLLVFASLLARGGGLGQGLLFIVLFSVNWLYAVIFELLPGAATPGKRFFGLHVMMANGLPITPAGCLLRNLLRAVDFLPLMYAFGIVCMLLRRDARRLGDLAAGTLVAYRTEVRPAGSFGPGEPIAPPVPLTSHQQAAITAFAWRVGRLTPQRAEEIALLGAAAAPGPGAVTCNSAESPLPMTTRLVGIARWLHGQRRTAL
jgi:uncharacterized RDD family membrane protein YckC